jgi:hypothetical protein
VAGGVGRWRCLAFVGAALLDVLFFWRDHREFVGYGFMPPFTLNHLVFRVNAHSFFQRIHNAPFFHATERSNKQSRQKQTKPSPNPSRVHRRLQKAIIKPLDKTRSFNDKRARSTSRLLSTEFRPTASAAA